MQARLKSLSDLPSVHSKPDRVRVQARRLVEWNAKYPKSAVFMSPEEIADAEMELDDIMTELQDALDGGGV